MRAVVARAVDACAREGRRARARDAARRMSARARWTTGRGGAGTRATRARERAFAGRRACSCARAGVEDIGTIEVWCLDGTTRGGDAAATTSRASALAGEDEVEALGGNSARLIARAFLRRVLATHGGRGVKAREVRFELGERGKPRVVAPRALEGTYFSLSHCDGLTAVCVSTHGEIGIDVEDENRRIGSDVMKFARRWLSPNEREALEAVRDDDERARAFMRLWTAKEAYVKALGLGIAGRPFREFDIDFGSSLDVRDDAASDGGASWRLAQFRPRADDSHVLSLCALANADGTLPPVRARWATLFDDDGVTEADFVLLNQSRRE